MSWRLWALRRFNLFFHIAVGAGAGLSAVSLFSGRPAAAPKIKDAASIPNANHLSQLLRLVPENVHFRQRHIA